jgi:hypothetical protein
MLNSTGIYIAVVVSALIAGLVTVATAPDSLVMTNSAARNGKGDRLDLCPVEVCSPRRDTLRDNGVRRRDRIKPERGAGESRIVSIWFGRTASSSKQGHTMA